MNTHWKYDYDRLAIYNSEVSRGLMHTDEYKAEMKKIQKEYNDTYTSSIWNLNEETEKEKTNG